MGLGRLSYELQHGMYLHPTLAVSPSGVALGVLDAWMWARPPKGEIAIRESRRWTEGYERVANTRLVYVADRESGLRELLDRAEELNHIGRKGDGHLGPKALWEGMMKLMAYVEALQTVHQVYGPSATCGSWDGLKIGLEIRRYSEAVISFTLRPYPATK